jgi:hypothetical protein
LFFKVEEVIVSKVQVNMYHRQADKRASKAQWEDDMIYLVAFGERLIIFFFLA